METVLVKNVTLGGSGQPSEPVSILIVNGKFTDTFPADKHFAGATTIDSAGLRLFPGFIDIHNHGAVGVDINSADTDGLLEVGAYLARHGVTSWLPTLVPDSDDSYRRAIAAIDKLMDIQQDRPIAQALGVHYEGVFASEKMCGALRPQYFKKFTGNEMADLPRLRRGIHMMTLAPEVDGGVELVHELVNAGWIVSIGHTNASPKVLDQAFAAGARHVTHFFNAMSGMHHRSIGVAGWTLTNSEVTFDIIADGIHVHPSVLEFACRAKNPAKVTLISDSVAPAGSGDGDFELWDTTISVRDGRTQNESGAIAGSVITVLDAVNKMLDLGFSPDEVSKMASANPANVLGLGATYGTMDMERRADIVGLDEEGKVQLVMIGGNVLRL